MSTLSDASTETALVDPTMVAQPLQTRVGSSTMLLNPLNASDSIKNIEIEKDAMKEDPKKVEDANLAPPVIGLPKRISVPACCEYCASGVKYPLLSRHRMIRMWHRYNIWVLLTVLAVIGGVVAYLNESAVNQLTKVHQMAISNTTFSKGIKFLLWSSWTVVCIILSSICVALSASHAAEGSGVAMVKSLLHHWRFFPDWYTFRTYFLKFVGLTLCVGSGVFMGRVDVHLCVILAVLLLRLKMFKNINLSDEARYQVLLAGSSVGLSANFGAPLAGILFAVELSGSYYRTKVYLKTIYVSILAAMTSRLLMTVTNNLTGASNSRTILAWINIIIPYPIWQFEELPFFLILGIICGFLGAAFVKLNVMLQSLKTKYGRMRISFLAGIQLKFIVAVVVAFGVAVLTFPLFIGNYMSLGNSGSIYELTSQRSLDPAKSNNLKANDWIKGGAGHLWANLLIYGFSRYLVTIVCFSLPVPGGPYTPLFAAGCGLGRLFGELVAIALPNTPVDPGAYAIVFAGALTAGATHQRFSSALIVLELTGRAVTFPLLISVLTSSLIAGALYPSLADAIIHIRGWGDYVEPVRRTDDRIEEFMQTDYPFVLQDTDAQQIDSALLGHPTLAEFPVIDSDKSRRLLGVVTKEDLEFLLMKAWNDHVGVISEPLKELTPQDKMGQFYKSGIALQEQNNIRDELDAARARQVLFKEPTVSIPEGLDLRRASIDRETVDSLEMAELGIDSTIALPNALDTAFDQKIVRGQEPAFSPDFENARDEAISRQENLKSKIHINPRPVSLVVSPSMTVISLHAIFTLCRLSVAYIIENGKLLGTVPASEIRILGKALKSI